MHIYNFYKNDYMKNQTQIAFLLKLDWMKYNMHPSIFNQKRL